MKTCNKKFGFTLIEMVLVVALIVILVSMVVGIAKRIDDQGKERLCRDTLALIDNALEQFRDFGFEYKDNGFAGLNFPLDCNKFSDTQLTYTIELSLNLPILSVSIPTADPCQIDNSGSEALYFFLNQVPDCRTTLDKIDKSLISNKSRNGELTLVIGTAVSPLLRFIDPWGTALQYDYYDDRYIELPAPTYPDLSTRKTFPVITSAGADKKFGTNDDIINRHAK